MSQITAREITSMGAKEVILEPQEMLNFIKTHAAEKSLWVYINGTQINPDKITIESLMQADNITFTNQILGG